MPLLLTALALVPAIAGAKPKQEAPKAGAGGKPACGVKIMPLAVGNQWTYNSIAAPLPPPEAIKRLSPAQPKSIVITVKSVEAKGADTVVTLEEKLTIDRTRDAKKPEIEEYAYESTVTCSATKFEISPNSFYFAGEPGGYIGLEIVKTDHVKGTSLALAKGTGTVGEAQWREDLAITWKHKPTEGSGAKLASGKVELERQFTPQDPEPITTKSGMMYKAEKIGLLTTGRVTLEKPGNPNYKPMELPAGWVSTLWMADNVGVIQTLNSYGHMYQLIDTTVK